MRQSSLYLAWCSPRDTGCSQPPAESRDPAAWVNCWFWSQWDTAALHNLDQSQTNSDSPASTSWILGLQVWLFFFSGTLQTISSSSFHRFLVLLHFLLSLSLNKFMYLLTIWCQYWTHVLCSLRLSSCNKIHGTSNSHSVAQVGPEFSAIFLTWLLRTGVTRVNYLIPQPLVHFHNIHPEKYPSVMLSRRNIHSPP